MAVVNPMKEYAKAVGIIQAHADYNNARMAFYQAEANFNNADPAYVDMAIEDLRLAEARMDNTLRKYRLLQTERFHGWTYDELIQAQKEMQDTGERAVIFMEIQRRKESERNG